MTTPATVIVRGGVIAFRTDTFYGLGANPFAAAAVRKLRELKGREDNKPILLLVSDVDQIAKVIAQRSEVFVRLANAFWPGPLTIVGFAVDELPQEITAGTGTVGVRLPDDETVRALVRECGGILTATSANPSGREPARSAQEVADYFSGPRLTGLDLIVDGGEVTATEPSTVFDATTDPPRVVREGAIASELIQQLFS